MLQLYSSVFGTQIANQVHGILHVLIVILILLFEPLLGKLPFILILCIIIIIIIMDVSCHRHFFLVLLLNQQ
jgi:hypothetical protein